MTHLTRLRMLQHTSSIRDFMFDGVTDDVPLTERGLVYRSIDDLLGGGAKGLVTIPAHILQKLEIEPYEQLEINFQNGVITMSPVKKEKVPKKNQLMAFAGAGQGCWGDTPEVVEDAIHKPRNSWTR